ncbi:MAG: DNA polymerase IV, partial [Bdellovibrionales bacterium]|nr:DNA polymerase IV [Bdellovibrionales bacterium]
MSARKIIHVDMDCYYAAIEMRDRPHLKGRPIAVGGNPNGRGVIATANYEARKFGVRSAMTSSVALRLCPQLEFIFPDFKKYKKASQQIRKIFLDYTPLVEPLSLDEAFLDVTHCNQCGGIATEIAREIRLRIFQETQLTCSAG